MRSAVWLPPANTLRWWRDDTSLVSWRMGRHQPSPLSAEVSGHRIQQDQRSVTASAAVDNPGYKRLGQHLIAVVRTGEEARPSGHRTQIDGVVSDLGGGDQGPDLGETDPAYRAGPQHPGSARTQITEHIPLEGIRHLHRHLTDRLEHLGADLAYR